MAWVDEVGWVEDTPPAPASYEEQVAMAQSWGVPANEIASIVGTPQSVAANNQAQAQAIQELTGSAPSWSQDVGYTAPPPSWLNPADYTANNYAAPYTQQQITGQVNPGWIRQMNGQTYASVKGPSDLSGGEYLIDPRTGKFALDAKGNPIGVTYPKSNGFSDWVTTPLGGLALTFGAPLAAMGGVAALEGLGALGAGAGAAEGAGALTTADILGSTGFTPAAGSSFGLPSAAAGAVGQALPYTEAYDAWNLAQQGLGASDIAQNLAATGMDSFLAADVGNLAAQGLSEAQIAQVIGASYTPAELAGTAFESAGWGPASSALSAADILKGLGAAAKGLTGSGLSSALRQGAASGLAPTLGKLAQGQSGMGMEIPGIVRTNTNPFYNTPQQPIQNPQKTEMSSLADILRQGKSSWQT